jgi:hypothetical protein
MTGYLLRYEFPSFRLADHGCKQQHTGPAWEDGILDGPAFSIGVSIGIGILGIHVLSVPYRASLIALTALVLVWSGTF